MIDCTKVFMLPYKDLTEAMLCDHSDKLIVGGSIDFNNRVVFLYTGKMKRVIIPFDWFTSCKLPIPLVPDFSNLEIIDCGLTVRFGGYEASSAAILHYARFQRW